MKCNVIDCQLVGMLGSSLTLDDDDEDFAALDRLLDYFGNASVFKLHGVFSRENSESEHDICTL